MKLNSFSVDTQPSASEFQYIPEPLSYDGETYKNPGADISTKIWEEMEAKMMGVRICRDNPDGDIKKSDFADVSNENDEAVYVEENRVSIIEDEMKARNNIVDKINTANKVGCTNHGKKRKRRMKSRKRSTRGNVQKPKTKRRTRKIKKIVESNRLIKHSNTHELGAPLRRAENRTVRTRLEITCSERSYTDSSTNIVERNWKKRKREIVHVRCFLT